MNCWPNSSDTLAATTRARMSVVPPAAKGTISLTGRVGHSAARARRGSSDRPPRAAAPVRTERRLGRRLLERIECSLEKFGGPYSLIIVTATLIEGSRALRIWLSRASFGRVDRAL